MQNRITSILSGLAQWRYLRRARRARLAMSAEQAMAFDAIVIDGLSVEEAAVRLSLSEEEVLRHFVQAFRIHANAIDAPGWP